MSEPASQADLNAAADLIEQYWSGADASMMKLARSIRAGHSQGVFPRAFAEHRLKAEADLRAEYAGLEAERDALQEELRKARLPQWFYYGDDCSGDRCRDSIYECIDEDFSWDNESKGDHVLQISGARPVPDIWVALHFYTDAEKYARDSDDQYAFTEHESEQAARAALSGDSA